MVSAFSVVLLLLSTFVAAVGALLVKKGVNKYSLKRLLRSKLFLTGIFMYGISFIFYLIPLRTEPLSVIYPFISMTYIWTTLFSIKFLGEKMNKRKWAGLAGIILGVILIGIGG